MDPILLSTIYGCVAGTIGTGLGGVISCFFKPSDDRLLAKLMGFSAGIMLAVVIFSMIPESLEMTGIGVTIVGLAIGAAFIAAAEKLLEKLQKGSRLKRVGILLFTGIALHNLPEGLAIGAGLNAPADFGIKLALLIMLHDIPEGLAMAIPKRMEGKNPILLTVLAGLPTAFGAGLGMLLGNISVGFIGGSIAFAGGAMLYLTLADLLPESASVSGKKTMLLSALVGLLAGAVFVFVL